MEIGRFIYKDEIFYGIITGGDKVTVLEGEPYGQIMPGSQVYTIDQLKTLAPCTPTKAVCVGLNYRDHAEEVGYPIPEEPILFIKPSTTVIGPGADITYPPSSIQVDYEAELAVVIGRTCRNVAIEQAREYILGYTCGNDVTARDLQRKDGQWTRAKSFDTFLPLGPYIITELDPGNLSVELRLNGETKQSSSTANLIFDVFTLVSFISGVMTLKPGDVIMTGTPGGIGPIAVGDKIEVEIQGIGVLSNGASR
ncbi:MAG: fumarylacetoacetate hydrolase family protein [Desulfotomaculaceae bacterium]|nr:fumarylacetoacetate hydrolase family protein [Desulfotomaculaceae bacterium]